MEARLGAAGAGERELAREDEELALDRSHHAGHERGLAHGGGAVLGLCEGLQLEDGFELGTALLLHVVEVALCGLPQRCLLVDDVLPQGRVLLVDVDGDYLATILVHP